MLCSSGQGRRRGSRCWGNGGLPCLSGVCGLARTRFRREGVILVCGALEAICQHVRLEVD